MPQKSESVLEAVMFCLVSRLSNSQLQTSPESWWSRRHKVIRSAQPSMNPSTYFMEKHLIWIQDLTWLKYLEGWGIIRSPGIYTHLFYEAQIHPTSPRGYFWVCVAYQLSCQTLLRAKCIDWFLIAPELGGREEMRKKLLSSYFLILLRSVISPQSISFHFASWIIKKNQCHWI